MLLSEIPKCIFCKKIYNYNNKNLKFNFITTNTKYLKKNSLLVVNKKNKFKKEYLKDAKQKGAIAIISNYFFKNLDIPQFIVNDVNKCLKKMLIN